ncbi:trichohyalin-like isoform X7 [Argopecten irradians]|uniref:trichohyalin-like isoform X7 n=1 Tax=Argopecten irradians TaxID=31199 RepID=UPI003713DE8C
MSSAMVGNGYPPNYNTYNSQPSPSHGQNLQEGYYDPHPSSRPPANEQQHYRSSPSQPHSVQTTPRRGVFYRLVSPDGGLPLGQYEEQRKYLDEQRQRDYLKMMSQKEKQEYQKREEEKVQKQVRDQKAQMQKQEQEKKLYNYNKVQKQFQEERRKDYEEFVKLQEIQNQIKLQMEKSGEEREITTEKHEKNEEIQYTQSNRTKKLSKRQNEAPRKLLVYQRGLQTPPWAEHYEVEDITTTEKIGHEDGKGKDLSNGKGLDEQPWYQNHQKSLKVPLLEKESNRNGKETYEPSILGHSDQVPSRHSNTGNAGAGRDRQDDNQTDEAKLNKYEERNTQGNDYGYNQKLSNPAQKGQQNGSFSGNERHHHSSHIEGQRINTQNSENHLWNNTRKLEYDKNFPGKKQSQDLLSEDLESWTSHQGRYGEGHRRQQGDQSRGGHVDKGQGVEGQHARKLETRHNTGQMAESQYHRNKEERRLSRGQKVEDQQSIHQNESRHGQSLTRNSQSPDDQHNDLRANGIDQQQKKYESPSGRGHWDKSHWDEGQLSKGQQEIGQNNENPKGNQKEDTEGKTFNDFMPFGGMLRRRKIDPAVLKAEFLKETQKNLNEWTLKENNPSPRRAPTPPNGLDIVTQDERTRMAREKQRQYGQELQRQTQEQMLQKIHNNIPVIDRTGQQPAGPNQYNHFPPQQHMMAPPPQYRASPPPSNVPSHPPHQSMSPPQQHSQQHQMQGSHRNHNHGTPAGSQSPPPRHRSHATPQRTEHGGYFPEFNGKQQSPLESRDGHRPPPHPRRYATPDRPDWARGPQRQNGTPTARSSHRRDDRQTPSYWNAGVPVKSPATTPSTRAPSTQQSNRTLTPKDSQDMIPDLHLESFRKDPMLDRRKEERNREYNKFLDEEHNREQQRREKLENLRKQPAVQPKYDNYSNSDNHERHRHNLESERRGEYQSFLSKNGEPVYPYARNPSSDLALSRLSGGLVGGIFGDVQHETDRRRAMINQRNKEYNELKKQLPQKTVRHIPSGGSRKEVDFENQKAFPMGNDYAEKQKKLREEWRKSYEIQMEKVGHSTYKKKSYTPQVQIQISKEEGARSQRDDSFRQSWERSMETPPIVPAGIYDQKRLQINAKMQADYQVYLASQQPVNRSKEFWGTNDNPRIYPTSGEYKKRGEKMKEELREEFHSFMDKQEPPKERKKVFGDQGSVLFVSKYPDTKKHMNAERRKEMIDYLEKKNGEVPRRQGDPSVDEKNMFSDMGKAQEAHSRRMQENARQDYKNYVDHAFPEGLNRGQPSFAAGKQPPDSWYSAQPPTHRYSPPRDLGPEQNGQKSNDPYTERLQQARANEAMYRRHDHEMNGQSQRAPPPRQEAPYALH